MNISYDWYRVFCCVAESGNITQAAEKLYISQPAVSQSIRQLEENVGCALFIRSAKGVRLTAEGQVLYEHISRGIAAFVEGQRRLNAMLRLDAGEIRIGASDMTLEFCLLPCLEEFHARYPGVKISITNNPTPQTVELLKQEKIDFAAVSDPLAGTEGFEVMPVRRIRDIFVGGSRCEVPDGIAVADLPGSELILLEGHTSTRTYLEQQFARRGFRAAPKFELATSAQIVRFAARNLGIGCVVADFAAKAIEEGDVREIKVSDPLPERNICILKKNVESSRAAIELLRMIMEHRQ